MSEEKRNIIGQLIEMYGIKMAANVQEALKDLLGGTFEPQVVPKYKKDISEIKGKIITMYARGVSVAQVSAQIQEIYTDGDGNQRLQSPPSAIHFSICPAICQGQAADAVAVFAVVHWP